MASSTLTSSEHLDALAEQVAGMTAALGAVDPSQDVPACPGWTVRELTAHVCAVHRWVLGALESAEPPGYEEVPVEGDLSAAYQQVADALLQRLTELPVDHPCWTFDRDDQTAGFWRRRQLHEIAVHRWDAAPYAMDEAVAEDGIDEAIDFMLPRMLAGGRRTMPTGTLRLVSPRRTWTVGEGEPGTVVEGSAGELLLGLWGRWTTSDPLPPAWREAKLLP